MLLGSGVPAAAALAAGARNRSDRGQCPAWRRDVVSRQRHRGAADGLVQRRRRLGRPRSGLYPAWPAGLQPRLGRGFHLRRADQRIMVGCGAAAAIAGAFGAPLAGAFYAFELVIGGYTPASLTPVGDRRGRGLFRHPCVFAAVARASASARSATCSGATSPSPRCSEFSAALVGITIMRGVALCEALLAKTRLWPPLRTGAWRYRRRPACAGMTPQVMSSGHGALHFANIVSMPLLVIATGVRPEGDRLGRLARQRLSRRVVFRHAVSGRARRPSVRGRASMRFCRNSSSIRMSMRSSA